jgi:hypothetical protein
MGAGPTDFRDIRAVKSKKARANVQKLSLLNSLDNSGRVQVADYSVVMDLTRTSRPSGQ